MVREWRARGLRCEIVIAARWLLSGGGAEPAGSAAPAEARRDAEPPGGRAAPGGGRILVVEDEAIVAMEFEATLRGLGYEVIGPAGTLGEALRLIETAGRIDAAVLDVNLAGCPSYPAADLLAERGVPMIVATGYGEAAERWRHGGRGGVLRKPLGPGELEAALRQAVAAPTLSS